MRKATPFLLSLGLFLGMAISAHAESPDQVTTTVPFTFIVNGAKLPAGTYIVKRVSQDEPSALIIQSDDRRHSAFFLSDFAGSAEPKLVFDIVDGEHYLREVGTNFGLHSVLRSRAQAQASRMAKNSENSSAAAGQ